MKYIDAGLMYRPETQISDFDDDTMRTVVKCEGCGALIANGGLSREKHDNFHKALADLFDSQVS